MYIFLSIIIHTNFNPERAMYVYNSWIEDAYENSIKIDDKGIEINVHVIIEKEDELFSAHCLEFDLVGEGHTIKESQRSLLNNIVNYVTYGISNEGFDKIINPAPPEYWNKLLHSERLEDYKIPPMKPNTNSESSFPFLRDLSGLINTYQAHYA